MIIKYICYNNKSEIFDISSLSILVKDKQACGIKILISSVNYKNCCFE